MSSATRQIDPEATRREILDAAQTLFIEKGFAGTSINAVAKEAGVTKSLIFHHFGTKENLWSQMAERLYQKYHDQQMELFKDEPSVEETLVASIRWHFNFLREHPAALRLEMWEQLDNLPCKEKPDDVMREGMKRFIWAQENGVLREDVPPMIMMVAFLSLVRHWFFAKRSFGDFIEQYHSDLDDQQLDQLYLDSLIKIYLEGILPRTEPPPASAHPYTPPKKDE